jgi:hypothetical protein
MCMCVCAQAYPAHDVVVEAKAQDIYRKNLPYKNGGLASQPPKPEIVFHVKPHQFRYRVLDHLKTRLDPEGLCTFTVRSLEYRPTFSQSWQS